MVLNISVFRTTDCIRKKPGEPCRNTEQGYGEEPCSRVVGWGTRGSGCGRVVDPWWHPVVWVRVTPLHCVPTVSPLWPTVLPTVAHCTIFVNFEKFTHFDTFSTIFRHFFDILTKNPNPNPEAHAKMTKTVKIMKNSGFSQNVSILLKAPGFR